MKKRYGIAFEGLKVGTKFSYNGNLWLKRSTRTAEIVKPEEHAGVWFYFGMNYQCIITDPVDDKIHW